MSGKTRRFFSAGAAALGMALIGLASSPASAASISYPNIGPVPPGVTFTNIVESSGTDGVPLFGAPTGFATGLDFNPTTFAASSAGGGVDLTDGQLNFTVSSANIAAVNLSESGTYSLGGVGTAATQALAAASLRATVMQINGVNVAPISLVPINALVAFNLVANPGALQLWSLNTSVNVAGQLATLGFGPNQRATRVDVVIDNQLVAVSQPGSTASISKDDFKITIDPQVPEPSALALAGLALCGLAAAARKRS